MKKLYILSHSKNSEEIIDFLQGRGVVHIRTAKEIMEREIAYRGETKSDESVEDYQDYILKIDYLLDFINRYSEPETLLQRLKKDRLHLQKAKIKDISKNFPLKELHEEAKALNSASGSIRAKMEENKNLYNRLAPWRDIDVSIEDLHAKKNVDIILLKMNLSIYETLERHLEECRDSFDMSLVNQDLKNIYLICICHKSVSSRILDITKELNAERVFLPDLKGKPEDVLKGLLSERGAIKEENRQLSIEARKLLCHKDGVMTLHDYYHSEKAKQGIVDRIFYTKRTFLILGWIEEKNEKFVKEFLTKQYPDVEVISLPPQKGEKTPVVLENNRASRPFEAITGLYGRPAYGGVDPTPYLTPFFALFFGLCLTDAVYGIVIIAFTTYAIKKWKLSMGAMKFFKVFLYGGIASLICGAVTGGWLGDFVTRLPNIFSPLKQVRRALILFDSIENATTFMLLAVILGFIQVLVGVLINLFQRYRYREWKPLLFRQLPAIGIQFSLVLIVITSVLKFWAAPAYIVNLLWSVFIISSLSIVYYHWTSQDKIALKLFWCWYGWYGVVTGNSLADILSYIRLFALGLTTALLALSINEICSLIWRFPYIGFLLSIIIFIPGHIFNLLINSLGAYVHTSRLQYYEFFMKFFEGGGAIFTPFTRNRKYVEIVD